MKPNEKPRLLFEQRDCPKVRLAEGPVAAVDECSCGMMQLHLGPLTVRLAPEAMEELRATLERALSAQAKRQANHDISNALGLGSPVRGKA